LDTTIIRESIAQREQRLDSLRQMAANWEDREVPYPTAMQRFPTVRQSLMANFDNCALSARLGLDHEEGWSSHPQGRGTIWHRFVAKALDEMHRNNERTIESDVALAILRECLRQHDVEDREVVNIPFVEIKDLRWMAIKFAKEMTFDIQHLADIELRLESVVLYENPKGGFVERRVTGQPDVLFIPEPDWGVVVDWKTSWALPRPNEVSESGYFQQRWYGFLVLERFPALQRVTLREHYNRFGETREATLFRSQLEDVREELAALVERFDRAVEFGEWPPEEGEAPYLWTPSPGAHCSYCPRPGSCPIFPAARVKGAITDEETAERWAAEAIVAETALKQRKEALRAWAGARKPIPIKHAKDPNRVWGHQAYTRTSRPTKEKLAQALREQGGDVNVNDLYEENTSTRFTQFSQTEPGDEAVDANLLSALEESVNQQQGKPAEGA